MTLIPPSFHASEPESDGPVIKLSPQNEWFLGVQTLEVMEQNPSSPLLELCLRKPSKHVEPGEGKKGYYLLPSRNPIPLPLWTPDSGTLDARVDDGKPWPTPGRSSIASGVESMKLQAFMGWRAMIWAWHEVWPRVRDVVLARAPGLTPPDWRNTWWWSDPYLREGTLLLVTMPDGAIPYPGRGYHLVAPNGRRQLISAPMQNPGPWGASEPECESLFWCAFAEGRYFHCADRASRKPCASKEKARSKKGELRHWED